MQRTLTYCRCGVANNSHRILKWLVVIGWAVVRRQQQGSDQASGIKVRHLAGRRCEERSEDGPLVNNSASGVRMLVFSLCVVATCVVSRVQCMYGHIASCCK